MKRMRFPRLVLLLAALAVSVSAPPVVAASRSELERDSVRALKSLYAGNSAARLLGTKARAILVFPNIVKAGFMFGGQIGEGVLLTNGRPAGYYSSVAASYGFQAGVQVFGYALFFMNNEALAYLGDRRRPEHRRRRRRRRQVAHQYDDHAGRLCLHLRSEGTDGRHRCAGVEDHEDLQVDSGRVRAIR